MAPDMNGYDFSRAPVEAILEVDHGAYAQLGIHEGWGMVRHACKGGGRPPKTGDPGG